MDYQKLQILLDHKDIAEKRHSPGFVHSGYETIINGEFYEVSKHVFELSQRIFFDYLRTFKNGDAWSEGDVNALKEHIQESLDNRSSLQNEKHVKEFYFDLLNKEETKVEKAKEALHFTGTYHYKVSLSDLKKIWAFDLFITEGFLEEEFLEVLKFKVFKGFTFRDLQCESFSEYVFNQWADIANTDPVIMGWKDDSPWNSLDKFFSTEKMYQCLQLDSSLDKIAYLENLLDKKMNAKFTGSTNPVKTPVYGLFCYILNDADIFSRSDFKTNGEFCTAVCKKYNLPMRGNMYKSMNTSWSNANLKKIKNLILPELDEVTQAKICKYIDEKLQKKPQYFV